MAVTAGELDSGSERVVLGNLLMDSLNQRRERFLVGVFLHLKAYMHAGPYSKWPPERKWWMRTADWKRTGL